MTDKGTFSSNKHGARIIYSACLDCKKERWINFSIKRGVPENLRCRSCAQLLARKLRKGKNIKENNSNWKGGRYKNRGYILVLLRPDDFFFIMADKNGYCPEHRLIMAQSLGRCLLKSEQVHHINSIKHDNRIENLELISLSNHNLRTKFCKNCEIKRDVKLLLFQNKLLLEQIRNLTSSLMGIK